MSYLNIWAETLRGRNVQSTSSVLQEWNEKAKKRRQRKNRINKKKIVEL